MSKTSGTSTGTDENDTFDKAGAIEWSEKDGNGTIADKTAKTTTFTTPTTPGNYEIILKIKDDGTHYQDYTALTQVNTLKIKVVKPDSVRIMSQKCGIVGRATGAFVELQVTYQEKDLRWKGYLAERYKESSNFGSEVPLPYIFNANGSQWWDGGWNTEGDYANPTSEMGQLTDVHGSPLPAATIPENKYFDLSGRHEVGFIDGSNKVSLKVFKDQDYVKREVGKSEEAVHDEVPF